MCGITGIIELKGERVSVDTLENMTRLVEHRGPDGGDTYLDGSIGLGHRLLSITGIEQPTLQPLQDPSGNYVIVFNGQVFNYRELKKDLEKKGHNFQTPSDTEVVLRSYMEYGEQCNQFFNGMWAFSIVDHVRQKVFLSRDRFGHKPLYYTRQGDAFVFFSELKQLRAFPSFSFRLNRKKALNFLVDGQQNNDEYTLLENVYSVRPGHFVSLDLRTGTSREICWYQSDPEARNTMDFGEAKEYFTELLYDSIKKRVPEKVTTGAFLSGGLDSSSILSMIHRNGLKKNISSVISCIIPFEGYNEAEYIDHFARSCQLDPVRFQPRLDETLFTELDNCLYHQDQPITGISHLAEWLLFVKAKECGVKVMLDGQGADEVLGGYQSFYYRKLLQTFRNRNALGLLRSLLAKMAAQKTSFISEIKNLVRFHPYLSRLPVFHRAGTQVKKWLNGIPEEQFTGEMEFGAGNPDHLISQISNQLFQGELPYLLHSMDRNSMAFGIETRLPYLDHRLVEFLLAMPDAYKMENFNTKRILRESMRESLPLPIINRKKMGFSTPDEILVKNISLDWWKLDELFERFPGMFSPRLKTDITDYLSGRRPYNYGFFRVLTFSRWASIFKVQLAATGIFNYFSTLAVE